MSCESCTGCFEAAPCSAPSPSLHGHISKTYRHFLKAARVCESLLILQQHDSIRNSVRARQEDNCNINDYSNGSFDSNNNKKVDHRFNTLIGILANNQFTAQTYLALAYKQLGPSAFLQLSRRLAHHGFWGRLLTWAFLFVKEDSERLLRMLVDQPQGEGEGRSEKESQDTQEPKEEEQRAELVQRVNDEAEMFEVFNPTVRYQRVHWNPEPLPSLTYSHSL